MPPGKYGEVLLISIISHTPDLTISICITAFDMNENKFRFQVNLFS